MRHFTYSAFLPLILVLITGCDWQFEASNNPTIPVSGERVGQLDDNGMATVFIAKAPIRSVVVYCQIGDSSDHTSWRDVSCDLKENADPQGVVATIRGGAGSSGLDYSLTYHHGLPPE